MGKTRLGGQTVAKAVKATSLTAESATITALTAAVTGDTAGTHTGAVVLPVQVANADGAITITSGVVMITKTGTLAALTLAAPAAADNGKRLVILSTTALAHTVTQTTPGFNNGSTASDVATFGAAIGNCFEVVAYGEVWYVVSLRNVTLG